jgi:hypothetical protein
MAPRPHNSGHYTIDACITSQFAQQVRAMARLPLGDVRQHSPAVMLNILGDVWFDGETVREPAWDAVLALPGANLHLYGKDDPRRGRKMGHVTFVAPTLEEAQREFAQACAILGIALCTAGDQAAIDARARARSRQPGRLSDRDRVRPRRRRRESGRRRRHLCRQGPPAGPPRDRARGARAPSSITGAPTFRRKPASWPTPSGPAR